MSSWMTVCVGTRRKFLKCVWILDYKNYDRTLTYIFGDLRRIMQMKINWIAVCHYHYVYARLDIYKKLTFWLVKNEHTCFTVVLKTSLAGVFSKTVACGGGRGVVDSLSGSVEFFFRLRVFFGYFCIFHSDFKRFGARAWGSQPKTNY